jgi:hypothetical protein
MKKWVLAAAAAIGLAGSANAAVVTLEGISRNGDNDFTFTYEGTLGPDEGVRSGDRLVIYDFNGYIDGSIMSGSSNVVASVEFSSPTALVTPGFTDDASIANLVFTYVGPDFRNTGGPFQPFNFEGLSARSTLGGRAIDAFFSRTTKNNPDNQPGGANTAVFTLGSVTVPGTGNFPDAIPEPATWAMMLGGFGLLGASMRRRNKMASVLA